MSGSAPVRIQRERTKGWRCPEGAIIVTRPTKWGNPFVIGKSYERGSELFSYIAERIPGGGYASVGGARVPFSSLSITDPEEACELYLRWLANNVPLWLATRDELRGHDLACWCPLETPNGPAVHCHADLLLTIANS